MPISPAPSTRSRLGRRRAVSGVLLVVALTTLASACSSGSGDASGTDSQSAAAVSGAKKPVGGTLHVGQLGTVKITEALLKASGEADDMPYSISWSLFPTGGGGFFEAVPSGTVDVAVMADTPPIFGQVAGIAAKVVAAARSTAPGTSTVEIIVPSDSPITSMADLKGKKVALTQGTILQFTVVQALKKAGLSYKDIKAVNLAPPDAPAALARGDVDAIATLDPTLSALKAQGNKVVGDGVGTTAGLSYLVATDAALKDPKAQRRITDYIQRLQRAEAWADANTDAWATAYAAVTGLPLPVAKAIVGRELDTWVPIDDKVYADQQEQADAYTQLGLIPKKLDVKAEFDTRYNDLAGSDK
jgi:sulfonate transport system substrate-binding protein